MDNQKMSRKISKTDKQIAGIFLLIGVATIIIGYMQFKFNISSPFLNFSPDYNRKTNTQVEQEALLALRAKDSDGDGLTDYDELYQYYTSPYIKDSDSDGIDDLKEVNQDTDPNCPVGTECVQASSADINNNTNQTITNIADLTTEQLREILVKNGIPQTTVDQLDDQTLIQYYQQVISSTAANNTNTNTKTESYENLLNNSNTNSEIVVNSTSDLTNLSAAQIRALLIQAGSLSEVELSQISDEQLLEVYQQSLIDQQITQ